MDAYQRLGIETCLVISDEDLGNAFRSAGKTQHPDGGGAEGEFAALREAYEMLASPSRRLKHWLGLHGMKGDDRGTVDDRLMGIFAEVGQATQRAESMVRKREEAMSALGRALLETETQLCREEIERAIVTVDQAIQEICAKFSSLEQSANTADAGAFEMVRNLAFLEKWRGSLRSCFARLV